MNYEFLGIEMEVPFGPAAGAINGPNIDNIIEKTRQIFLSPLTISRWASATYNGGEGNEPKYGQVYYHNNLTGQTVNSLGLPSVSIDVMEKYYPDIQAEAEDRGKVVIPGVSAAVGDDPLEVLPEMAERLVLAGAKRIEVNYSCPNKIIEGGGREPVLSNDPDTMFEVDQEILKRVGEDIWIIRKIAPILGVHKVLIPVVTDYYSKVNGKVALSFNTIGGQSILTEDGETALNVPENKGGLSGPATKIIGRNMLEIFRSKLPNTVQIDSTLGVSTGEEVFLRTETMGANFTSGVTIFTENEKRGLNYNATGRRIADQFFDAKIANI